MVDIFCLQLLVIEDVGGKLLIKQYCIELTKSDVTRRIFVKLLFSIFVSFCFEIANMECNFGTDILSIDFNIHPVNCDLSK